ncbi:MAG: ferrochelatase [Rhodobacteraceae bacterium]|nr:MAG: ferrochelatase [Paracoccaceae bacterium]
MTKRTANPDQSTPAKTGVLVANLGTPDNTDYWSMRRYLSQFLSDRRVIDYPPWKWQPLLQLVILTKRPFSSGAAYRSIWNTEKDESPLLTITRAQCDKIRATLTQEYGDTVVVDFCMRYGNPSVQSAVEKLKAQGCDRIVFFPLYPQYSATTTATANDEAFRTLMQMKWQPYIRTVPAYFDRPDYIAALANSVTTAYDKLAVKPDVLVASYHGMPKRYLTNGDPYYHDCIKTTELLQAALGWGDDKIKSAFQSKFGVGEWLKPYAVEEVARLAKAGKKHMAVIAPAFSADCIETLEEIQEEIKESFLSAGGETFTYIPCLNDSDDHIAVLTNAIKENLSGWVTPA